MSFKSPKYIQALTMILIPALLLAGWLLAKPKQPAELKAPDRLQWSDKASQYKAMPGGTVDATSPAPAGQNDVLRISPEQLDAAALQISLRIKPRGSESASEVQPAGSGTLTVGGSKFSFAIDSMSVLRRYVLSDGSIYVRGPMGITVQTPQGARQAVLEVSSVLDSKEGIWLYANPDGLGIVQFGTGFKPERQPEINGLP
ncbi:hypothetical protein ACFFK0_04765 [Paenibacillus chartarius]|uniref:FecR protein domain-containing protein n=1 Tax=Paenibacillus chartarius TaxID=747481 RepID=A0ABV6DGP9_9BACL